MRDRRGRVVQVTGRIGSNDVRVEGLVVLFHDVRGDMSGSSGRVPRRESTGVTGRGMGEEPTVVHVDPPTSIQPGQALPNSFLDGSDTVLLLPSRELRAGGHSGRRLGGPDRISRTSSDVQMRGPGRSGEQVQKGSSRVRKDQDVSSVLSRANTGPQPRVHLSNTKP